MTADSYPLQDILLRLAGWILRHQPTVIEYRVEETRACMEQAKRLELATFSTGSRSLTLHQFSGHLTSRDLTVTVLGGAHCCASVYQLRHFDEDHKGEGYR